MLNETNFEENSVPNRLEPSSAGWPPATQIQPRKQPGLYMVRCVQNDWRYYGESQNVSGRLSSHRSLLNQKIHPNTALQVDWNTYGSENFDFVVLFMGKNWNDLSVRRGKELELIILDRTLCYNIYEGISKPGEKNPFWGKLHTPETKKKNQ